jgi:hypothetical protein
MSRAPTDKEILRMLDTPGRTVTHSVLPSGQHSVEITWHDGWAKSGARHAEYAIALRMAAVGVLGLLPSDKGKVMREMTPKRLHKLLPAGFGGPK